jgi:hypothetical protein
MPEAMKKTLTVIIAILLVGWCFLADERSKSSSRAAYQQCIEDQADYFESTEGMDREEAVEEGTSVCQGYDERPRLLP